MSVRKLDLPLISGRLAFIARRTVDPTVNLGVAQTIEIPDPITLVELADKAGLSLEWLLYGVSDQETGDATLCSKGDHPPPVNLVLQQAAMVKLREFLSGPILTKAVREVMANWIPDGTINEAAIAIADLAAARARGQFLIGRNYINASGIVVHTGWGNAPLGATARERLLESVGATPTGAASAQGAGQRCAVGCCVP
jgi:hypothetical protein